MNSSVLSSILRLLIFSLVTLQLTSSASFPHPPRLPSPNASPEEWSLFMKFLHNYYAIIARPRFGKRYDSETSPTDYRQILEFLRQNSEFSSPSNDQINYLLSRNDENMDDRRIDFDTFYTFSQSDRRRRRRRR